MNLLHEGNMKAIVYDHYGDADQLYLDDVPKPTPRRDQVLVQLKATSINDWDWGLVQGKPFANRVSSGLKKPKMRILGSDIAGVVTEVGREVTQFKPGDEVLGDLTKAYWGGFAQFVCAHPQDLTLKPSGLDFVQAAALLQAGLLAMQGLQKYGPVQSGEQVLINGAGGGAGSFAIQMAKSMGAVVTGVDSHLKQSFMTQMGADFVVDYQKEDYFKASKTYDRILDLSCHHSFFDSKRALSAQGKYIVVGGATGNILQTLLLGPLFSKAKAQQMGLLLYQSRSLRKELLETVAQGKVTPAVDRVFPLAQTPEAMAIFASGQSKGKLVIQIEF